MRLFVEEANTITVHEFLPNHQKVVDFKKREINSIPVNERVLRAERNSLGISIEKDNLKNSLLNLIYKQNKESKLIDEAIFHRIASSELDENTKKRLLENYIYEDDHTYYPHKIYPSYIDLDEKRKKQFNSFQFINDNDKEILRKVKYYITRGYEYKKDESKGIEYLEGIINSTENLYLYHLLLNEKYNDLEGKDVTNQFNLFWLKEQSKFDKKQVRELDNNLRNCGIRLERTNYELLMDKVKRSEKVLKLIKDESNN